MSILLFAIFCAAVAGKVDLTGDSFLYIWALFSIADALWVSTLSREAKK